MLGPLLLLFREQQTEERPEAAGEEHEEKEQCGAEARGRVGRHQHRQDVEGHQVLDEFGADSLLVVDHQLLQSVQSGEQADLTE